jgi:hypothetical protein
LRREEKNRDDIQGQPKHVACGVGYNKFFHNNECDTTKTKLIKKLFNH